MKIRVFILALFAMLFATTAWGQTAAEVEASNQRMLSASAKCNAGPEAFKSFIEKFSTDQAFMESRLQLSADEREQYASLLVPDNFTAKVPFEKDGDEYYQMWGEIQWGKVYLDCGWVDSYCTHTFEFKRIDGKWYLAHIVPGE